ncbi:MAG: tetratricopeptide repeat protein [Bryobacterales bacterium]|nr:tetratricopeptide repeat protein [Bryobacterales bacterium]
MAAVSPRRERRNNAATQGSEPGSWVLPLGCFLLFFVACEVYGPALNGPFVFDDQYLPFVNGELSYWRHWIHGSRPMTSLTFWFNYEWSRRETFSYHLVNLLFHAANSFLVYLIARKFIVLREAKPGLRETVAGFCGALFLLHPVQTEAVSYIVSRSENLAAFFFYGAFTVFLYRGDRPAGWGRTTCILVLFACAAASKEHAVTLPALMLLTDYFWNPGFTAQGMKRNWRLYGSFALAGALAVPYVVRLLRPGDSAGFGATSFSWYQYFFTQCRAIFVYLRLFVAPFGQTIDYDFPISKTILDHGSLAGLAGLLAMAGAAFVFRRRYPLGSFGVLVFLLLLTPTSSVMPILDPIAERRMYLPLIGLLFMAAEALLIPKFAVRKLAWPLSAVLAVCALLTYQRNLLWASPEALWKDAVAKSPGKQRAHFQLAYAYYEQRRCGDAEREYEIAARVQEPDYRLLLDWALAHDCAGRPGEAISKLLRAIAINRTAHAYSQLGLLHAKQNHHAEALEAYDIAQKLDPRFEWTYFYRGNLYALDKNYAAAIPQFSKAIALNPRNEQARAALASAQSLVKAVP